MCLSEKESMAKAITATFLFHNYALRTALKQKFILYGWRISWIGLKVKSNKDQTSNTLGSPLDLSML